MDTKRVIRFRQFFDQYYPALCQTAYGYLSDADDCEDLVQDLFVAVWNKDKDLLPDAELVAYLKAAVRNNCISLLRRRQRVETVSMDDEGVTVADGCGDSEPTTDYQAMLDAVLSAMPPKCRDVFMMSKLQKMKYKEIAETLDISEKTVENHIGKAFKIIRMYAAEHPVVLLVLPLSQLIKLSL